MQLQNCSINFFLSAKLFSVKLEEIDLFCSVYSTDTLNNRVIQILYFYDKKKLRNDKNYII